MAEAPPALLPTKPSASLLIATITLQFCAREETGEVEVKALAHIPRPALELVAEALVGYAGKLRESASKIVQLPPGARLAD